MVKPDETLLCQFVTALTYLISQTIPTKILTKIKRCFKGSG